MVGISRFRARLIVVVALSLGAASAQTTSHPTTNESQKAEHSDLVFHSSVRRVIVDVVVSDANGKTVSGLTADDFSVQEDGKNQTIRSFDVHNFDAVSGSALKAPAFLPINTFVNVPSGPERGPLYVLLLDLVNMDVDDQPVAREQLMKFIMRKPLGTRFAIFVLSDGLYLVQGFTEDRNRLADAVDTKSSRSHLPRVFLYADNYRPSISLPQVLVSISKFLADLPGHKNIIWLSASFPSTVMPTGEAGVEANSMNSEIKEATDTLARGQIAVYPVDVRGVVATSASAANVGGPTQNYSANAGDYEVNARHMTEEEIAEETGGHAFYGSNDIADELVEATETGGHYYTLTYSPTNQDYNGNLRHIHVQLAKRGYHLAYRRSYYGNPNYGNPVPASPKHAEDLSLASELNPFEVSRPADSLRPNMQHGAPLVHQLLFRAHIHAVTQPAKATRDQLASLADQPAYFREGREDHPAKPPRSLQLQTYQIDYTVAARYPSLEIAAAAYDADGKMLNGVVQRAEEEGGATGNRRDGIYRVQQIFDVPTSAVSMRVAVRDVATDNIGALEVNLPLPSEEVPEPTVSIPEGVNVIKHQ